MPTILYQQEVDTSEELITFDFGRPISDLIKGDSRQRVEIVIVALDTDPEECLAQTMEAVERTRALDIGQDKLVPAQQGTLADIQHQPLEADRGSYVRYIESLVEANHWDGEEEHCMRSLPGSTNRSTVHEGMKATNSMLVQLHRAHAVSMDRHAEEIVALKSAQRRQDLRREEVIALTTALREVRTEVNELQGRPSTIHGDVHVHNEPPAQTVRPAPPTPPPTNDLEDRVGPETPMRRATSPMDHVNDAVEDVDRSGDRETGSTAHVPRDSLGPDADRMPRPTGADDR